MDRRSFFASMIASGALYSSGALPGLIRAAIAAEFPVVSHPLLASVLLSGGPDFRYLLPPAYASNPDSFGYQFWHANAASHELEAEDTALQTRWENDYFHLNANATDFGILGTCGWLKRMWDQGNVAIINNVLTTSSRNHPLGIQITEQGDRRASFNQQFNAPGWGGLLADNAGRNVTSLTALPRKFCYNASITGGGRASDYLISATDTRNIALFAGNPEDALAHPRRVSTRSLSSYYAAQRNSLLNDPRAARFAQHESKLRQFGGPISERLAMFPEPDTLSGLYEPTAITLNNPAFGRQIRNLYDCLACADILNMGIAALEYSGWDTHRAQKATIEPRLEDLFGDQQAFDTLYAELPASVSDNLVITLHGEFGRQIRANGDGGTDHGEGATVLVIGNPVNGGIYGDQFPAEELGRLDEPSPQITGRTGIEVIYARIADWFNPGSSAAIFPNVSAAPVETGLNLDSLFT